MSINTETILKLSDQLFPRLVKFRRHLHKNPELSYEEFQTTKYINGHLIREKIKTKRLKLKTGLLGLINEKKKVQVAVRTDIDALPVTELTGLPFKSIIPGRMHACGHDIHMSVGYGTALLLNSLKKELPGGVKFLFQPAEEQPPGGASAMIKEGVLKNPNVGMIYGLHVDPTLTTGKISLRDGPVMASVIDFDITVFGRGGHAALPHRAVDAIAVAAEMIGSIQKIVSRETNPLKPVVITFGTINGGTVRNVIADKVILNGTARTLDSYNARALPRLLKRTISGICRARGAKYKLDILSGYPVLENHTVANKYIASAYLELFGGKKIDETQPTMGGEDFSYYLKKIPGAFFRLGVKNDKIKANKPWHSPHFIADERAIYYGTAIMSLAVIRTLESLKR